MADSANWKEASANGALCSTTGKSIGIGTAAPAAAIHALGGTNPTVRLEESSGSPADFADITGGLAWIRKTASAGACTLALDPLAGDGTSSAVLSLFRYTNTTGTARAVIYSGDGSASVQSELQTAGDSTLNAQAGDLNVGGASNIADLNLQEGAEINIGTVRASGLIGSNTTGSTARTLVYQDVGAVLRTTSNGSAVTITVQTNAVSPIPIGSSIAVCQYGTSPITFAAAGGVTLNSRGSLVTSNGQYAVATLIKVAADEWVLSGDLV